MIDKSGKGMPDDDTLTRLHSMFSEMKSKNMDFYEVEFGATDITTATNHDEIFSNDILRDISRMFKITTVNGSFIEKDSSVYSRFAKRLHEFTPDNWFGLAIPIEMKHVFNDKYIDRIRDNVTAFKQAVPNYLKEVVLTVIFDETYINVARGNHTYEQLFDRCNSLNVHDSTLVDFVFHHGRTNITSQWVKESFKRSIVALNEQYLLDMARRGENCSNRFIPAQLIPESHNNELVLHESQLYVRPVLNERVTVIHDKMKFIGPWTYENFISRTVERFNANLEAAQGFEVCSQCPHIVECSSNYVHDLMGVLDTRDCLLIKQGNL